ncbi:Putative ribonuclease H protein At1g65750 [Linum perenne]
MDKKLTGWKSKTLTFAGRVTLAVAVLNTIPAFSMQTAKLPERTLELINKRIRVFILGAQNGERKIHLVNWDTVYLPKKLGGLGYCSKILDTVQKNPSLAIRESCHAGNLPFFSSSSSLSFFSSSSSLSSLSSSSLSFTTPASDFLSSSFTIPLRFPLYCTPTIQNPHQRR